MPRKQPAATYAPAKPAKTTAKCTKKRATPSGVVKAAPVKREAVQKKLAMGQTTGKAVSPGTLAAHVQQWMTDRDANVPISLKDLRVAIERRTGCSLDAQRECLKELCLESLERAALSNDTSKCQLLEHALAEAETRVRVLSDEVALLKAAIGSMQRASLSPPPAARAACAAAPATSTSSSRRARSAPH
eukprot:TRINITY_DN25_c1_g1_i1.p1 TRINITY_DN25_c1_g1~~TRINITY_DN25_c1_g1_i1.p1  ORF type:complete len:189 (+),score=32.70 TRINITY_DN25_c1_g1_i1:122-688(+)